MKEVFSTALIAGRAASGASRVVTSIVITSGKDEAERGTGFSTAELDLAAGLPSSVVANEDVDDSVETAPTFV